MRKLRLLKSALSCRQMRLPPQHPDVASAMYLYACAAGEAGDMPLKRDLCAQALEIYEMHVPSDSLDLVPVLVNLAAATVGDSPARRQLLERALCIKEQHVGDAHPDLVSRFTKLLGLCLPVDMFNYRLAYLHHWQTLSETAAMYRCVCTRACVCVSARGLYVLIHILLGVHSARKNYCFELWHSGTHRASFIRCFPSHVFFCRETAFGLTHPDLTSVIVNLGNTYGVLGKAQKKKELLERALAIQQAHFGSEHIEASLS